MIEEILLSLGILISYGFSFLGLILIYDNQITLGVTFCFCGLVWSMVCRSLLNLKK